MSNGDDDIPDGAHTLAAEYVLGVLSAAERRAVAARLATDAALATEVAYWESRLGALAEDVAPVAPPTDVWNRIDAATRSPAATRRSTRAGLWQSLAFWRSFGVASAGLAVASLAALFVVTQQPPPQQPPLVAALDVSGTTGFVATVAARGDSITVVPATRAGTDPRAMELWIIPPGGQPHSLGLIERGRPVQVTVPPELVPHMRSDAVLAVSLEPQGGSPTGQPTGPVIANGKLTRL